MFNSFRKKWTGVAISALALLAVITYLMLQNEEKSMLTTVSGSGRSSKRLQPHFEGRTDIAFRRTRAGRTEVRVQNVCLETQGERQILWAWGINRPSRRRSKRMSRAKPSLGDLLPLQVMDSQQLRNIANGTADVEWLDDEYHLFQRTIVSNLFHWMQVGYGIHSQFFMNSYDKPRRAFHIPSRRKFAGMADLSYVRFVSMLGIEEQRTVYGVVDDLSDKHADEILDNKLRFTCFSNAVLGQIYRAGPWNPWNSDHFWNPWRKDLPRLSYMAYLEQIRSALSLPPPKIACPAQVTIILRHLNSTRQSRNIVNFDEVKDELDGRNIDYHFLDMALEPDLSTVRQQIEFSGNRSILVAAHGQALWLSHFLPNEASVVEILPYGFEYPSYQNIAASHGLFNYTQIEVPRPWTPAIQEQWGHIKSEFVSKLHYNETAVEGVLAQLPGLLRPGSNELVERYLISLLGGVSDVSLLRALAKIFARDQPLWVNATQLVDVIQYAVSYQTKHNCAVDEKLETRRRS